MKLLDYSLPLAAALLLMAFFSGLPALKSCTLPRPSREKAGRLDVLLLLLITGAYALVTFCGLGDRTAPQSFTPMAGRTVELTLPEDAVPAELMLYCGVGIGDYTFQISTDGEAWEPLLDFNQDHVAVLKWHSLDLSGFSLAGARLRITETWGDAWLGELVFRDAEGAVLSPAACDEPLLVDEQGTAPAAYSYLNSTYFDEIYHARTAWEHLHGVWPYEISHPPLGKEILSLGILLFGMTPFGWRFMGTLFGALMLPVMYLFLKKLFGGRAVPALGTLLLASDFMHLTQTRIATIDTYGVFFILLMYLFLYLWLSEDRLWALALSGIAFGLGAASKWTAIYAGAGLAVLWAAKWIGAFVSAARAPDGASGRSSARALLPAFLRNVGFCLFFFVLVPCLIYYFSYLPYGRAQYLDPFSREYFHMVLSNQQFMFSYHSSIVAEHPYSSRWYQWLLNIRPILYYLDYYPDGTRSSIAAFLNPALCWGGLLSLFVLLYTALFRRDRQAAFLLVGYLAQLLPWVFISRLTFAYHYFPCSVFLVLSLGYVFALMRDNRPHWLVYAGSFTAVSVLLFFLYLPVLTGTPVDGAFSKAVLQWLPTWPIVRIFP